MKISHGTLKFLFGAFFWFAFWEIAARFLVRDFALFPPLVDVFSRLGQLLLQADGLSPQILASAQRFMLALIAAAPLAYALALLSSVRRNFGTLVDSFVRLSYPLPKVALVPFLLLILGTGSSAKVVLIGLGMFYLIYLNVAQETRELLGGPLHDVAQIYEFKGFNYWIRFLLRGTFPSFLGGLTTATGYGLTLVVVSEMSMSNNGLGYFIWSAWDSFRILDMYAGLVLIGLIGFIIHTICAKSHNFINRRRGMQ